MVAISTPNVNHDTSSQTDPEARTDRALALTSDAKTRAWLEEEVERRRTAA
jgi:hypothetical protein